MTASETRALRDIVLICVRNIISLSNVVIFVVLGLLFYFGEHQSALFLSIAIVGGVLVGLYNDIRARLALEKLQLLTTPMYKRLLSPGVEERVYAEKLQQGDRIMLVLGDQVPCDATLVAAQNLEISQALLTGESDSYPKSEGEKVLAGDIIVAGFCTVRIDTSFAESELSKMTSAIKRYTINLSPVQQSIKKVISYSGYMLLGFLVFIVARGYFLHESTVDTITSAAALTSTVVPDGLMVAITILFAYGAMAMYRKQVLMQDVNATEKLGHIKNLCIDKTGTLTENIPTVVRMHVFGDVSEQEALEQSATYIKGSGDSSQTAQAILKFTHPRVVGTVLAALPFTSERQFGAIELTRKGLTFSLVMGGPDTLMPHIPQGQGQEWLHDLLTSTDRHKRLVCVARADVRVPPQTLVGVALHPVVVFELESTLREGTKSVIDFFQKRGVRVRVISGDSLDTVQAIAKEAGVSRYSASIVGSEIEQWSESDFAEKTDQYSVFARIRPELKEKLIKQLRKTGFTAMVGDGANDALAIKQADLGIAMFEGATATRGLASVVLMNNSFSALPQGIRLADTIIGNAQIIASLYFFEMGVGIILFAGATFFGHTYPLSPQNVILLNYFSVGFPSIMTFFWTMHGIGQARESSQSFLRRSIPFAAASALAAGLVVIGVFLAHMFLYDSVHMQTVVLLSFICMNLTFFFAAPFVLTEGERRQQVRSLFLFGVVELLGLLAIFAIPFTQLFFDVVAISFRDIVLLSVAVLLFAATEYALVRYFIHKK